MANGTISVSLKAQSLLLAHITWQRKSYTVSLRASNMNALPALIDAIENTDLPAAVYRTAVRLARLADDQGRAVLSWAEYQALTGCSHADAARRHLRALRDAKLVSWRGGETVVVVWLVSRHYVSEKRPVVSGIRQYESENRQYVRVDNNGNGHYHETKRPVVSASKHKAKAARCWHQPKPTVQVGKKTCSVWKRARTVGKQTSTVCHLYVWARAVCLIDPYPKPVSVEANKQSINQSPARDDKALAYDLLAEIGVASDTARKLAALGFDQVRRAVAAWYVQRKEVGGKLENHPGVVVYWLNNPGKAGFPAQLPTAWLQSELGKKYALDRDPPAPDATEVPGVYALQPPTQPAQLRPAPPKPPAPMPSDDPWAICLKELSVELPAGYVPTLNGSHIEAAGEIQRDDGKTVPLYRILIAPERAAAGLNHFTRQAGVAIRRKLGTVLGYPVQIDIVAAEVAR